MRAKRKVDLVVISDIHLGTYGCHAKELGRYLKSIEPKTLILNGDIIDIWQFNKRYWPKSHMKVVKHIISLTTKGTKVYYITGNHDETLRKFAGVNMGNLLITNKLELNLDEKKAWFFHGDVFDVVMQNSRWLAKIGTIGYDALIHLNTVVNKFSQLLGKGKVSLSKKVKDNVKSALKYINDFEESAATLALQKGFDYIVCGHIHHPDIRVITHETKQSITYLNSGDWIENLSALEYNNKEWKVYYYKNDVDLIKDQIETTENTNSADLNNTQIFNLMLQEFQN